MLEHTEPLPDRLGAARVGLEALLRSRTAALPAPAEHDAESALASTAPEAGFRHWGDTPQWYDWHKR